MIDRARIKAEWAARGVPCDLWSDPSGHYWEDLTYDINERALHLIGE